MKYTQDYVQNYVQDYVPRFAGRRIIAPDRMRDPAGPGEADFHPRRHARCAIVSEEVQGVPFFNR
jgi:hypothetical protein